MWAGGMDSCPLRHTRVSGVRLLRAIVVPMAMVCAGRWSGEGRGTLGRLCGLR